jgi:hypothetical protein
MSITVAAMDCVSVQMCVHVHIGIQGQIVVIVCHYTGVKIVSHVLLVAMEHVTWIQVQYYYQLSFCWYRIWL